MHLLSQHMSSQSPLRQTPSPRPLVLFQSLRLNTKTSPQQAMASRLVLKLTLSQLFLPQPITLRICQDAIKYASDLTFSLCTLQLFLLMQARFHLLHLLTVQSQRRILVTQLLSCLLLDANSLFLSRPGTARPLLKMRSTTFLKSDK